MVEANSCPSLCSRGQPSLPAPGAHGGASLAAAADSEAAVTRPGLEPDTMTGEPCASRDPTERPPAPRGGGGAWASCPSHRAPTGARAQVPPGQFGEESPGCREPWAGCFRRGFCPHWQPVYLGTPSGAPSTGGQQGRAAIPAQMGRGIQKAGAWGRSWLPRGEPGGGAPGQRPACAVGASAPGREGQLRSESRPFRPGYRRPPGTRPCCSRRACGPESQEAGGEIGKLLIELHFLK